MWNKIYNFIIWAGLTFLLIWSPLAFGAVPKRIWSITPVLLISTFLVFLWLWKLNNGPRSTFHGPQMKKTALDKPILAFVGLAVISFIFSIYKHDSFYALLRLFVYVGIFYFIVNNYSWNLRRYLISLVICAGTALSAYGLLQYFGILPHPWWEPKDFLAATYVNHNHFAGYLELAIPVAVGVLIGIKSCGSKIKLFLISAIVIMLTAFIFAQSRGAWICLGISLFAMNIILIKKKFIKKESLLIFVLLIVLTFMLFYATDGLVSKRIESIKEIGTGEASMNTRFAIWQGTIDMISHNPLIGTGIGTFTWGFPRYRPMTLASISVNYAHNDYLHMAAEMGLFALPIMLIILVRIISSGLSKADPVVIGCAIGILSLSLHGLVDFNFHIPANMILVAVYAAIIMKES